MGNYPFFQTKQVDRLEAIKKHIADNLDKDLSIDALAEEFKIGASTLRSHFLIYYNQSVHSYVVMCKIEKAKLLLAENVKSIEEISTSVGFGERTAFTRAFKKQVGCTPLQYIRAFSTLEKQTLTNSSSLVTKSSILDSLPGK